MFLEIITGVVLTGIAVELVLHMIAHHSDSETDLVAEYWRD